VEVLLDLMNTWELALGVVPPFAVPAPRGLR